MLDRKDLLFSLAMSGLAFAPQGFVAFEEVNRVYTRTLVPATSSSPEMNTKLASTGQPQLQEGEVHWPSSRYRCFDEACEDAVLSKRPLRLESGVKAELRNTFTIKGNRDVLSIRSSRFGYIESSAYSMFSLSGKHSILRLQGIYLNHTAKSEVGNGSDVGAAVFAMGHSRLELYDSEVTSSSGLGLWLVQSANLEAKTSRLSSCGRSGLAMFGHASALLQSCGIVNCAIHGLCARGDTNLSLSDCDIQDCVRRGVYAYQRSRLFMEDCRVTGTQDASRAAVEIAGARPSDDVQALIKNCFVTNNVGAGIRLRGAVKCKLYGNKFSGNSVSDVLQEEGEDNGAWPVLLPFSGT